VCILRHKSRVSRRRPRRPCRFVSRVNANGENSLARGRVGSAPNHFSRTLNEIAANITAAMVKARREVSRAGARNSRSCFAMLMRRSRSSCSEHIRLMTSRGGRQCPGKPRAFIAATNRPFMRDAVYIGRAAYVHVAFAANVHPEGARARGVTCYLGACRSQTHISRVPLSCRDAAATDSGQPRYLQKELVRCFVYGAACTRRHVDGRPRRLTVPAGLQLSSDGGRNPRSERGSPEESHDRNVPP